MNSTMPSVRQIRRVALPVLPTVSFDTDAPIVPTEADAFQRGRDAGEQTKSKQAAQGVLALPEMALRRDDASVTTPPRMDALVNAAALGDVELLKSCLSLASSRPADLLVAAARNGQIEAMMVIVDAPGVNPTRLGSEGTPLLVAAAQSNDAATVAYVLGVAPSLLNDQDAWGHTAFDWAVVEGSRLALAPLLASAGTLRTDGWVDLALKSPQRGRAALMRRLIVHGLDPGDAPVTSTASSVLLRLVGVGRFQATHAASQFLRLLSWDAGEDDDVDAAAAAAMRRVLPHWDSILKATVDDLRLFPPRSVADRRVVRVMRWWVVPCARAGGGAADCAVRFEACMSLWRAVRAVDVERVALRAAASIAFESRADERWRRGRMLALWYEAGSDADAHVRLLCWKAVTGDEEALESGSLEAYVLNALATPDDAPS